MKINTTARVSAWMGKISWQNADRNFWNARRRFLANQFKTLMTHNSMSHPSLSLACITQWISTNRPANVKTFQGYGSAGTLQPSSYISLSYPSRKSIADHPLDCPLREQSLKAVPNTFTHTGPGRHYRYLLKTSAC